MEQKRFKSGRQALKYLLDNVKGLKKGDIYVEYKKLAPFLIIIPHHNGLKKIYEYNCHFDDLVIKLQEWVDTGVFDDCVYVAPYTSQSPDICYTGEVFRCYKKDYGYRDIRGSADLATEYRNSKENGMSFGFYRVKKPMDGKYKDFVSGMFDKG